VGPDIALQRGRPSGEAIAEQVGVSLANSGRILQQVTLCRMRDLDPLAECRALDQR
jgi:hypothetical protein